MENMVNIDFWRGKRVLITGHTGFKGSWLSFWLQLLEAEVTGYSLPPPTHPSHYDFGKIGEGMISIEGDIRNFDHLKKTVETYHPEIVIHMAAQSLVRKSYQYPIETYSTNIMGTIHVLEAIRQIGGVKVIVNVTSDKCYENQEHVWGYREIDPMGGFDPYSSSKGCAELITSAYRKSFFNLADFKKHGVALASVRAGNVIGGGDWAEDRLLPDIIKAFLENREVYIRSPQAIRPWQHVMEPLSGYLLLAEKLYTCGSDYTGGWNFGPSEQDEKSVLWIIEQVGTMWESEVKWKIDDHPHPHEAHFLKLDSSKARSKLGWSPRLNIQEALKWTVVWYKQFQKDLNSVRKITESQILEYNGMVK